MENIIIVSVFVILAILGTMTIRRNFKFLKSKSRTYINLGFGIVFIGLPYLSILWGFSAMNLNIEKISNPITIFLFVILFNAMVQTLKDKISIANTSSL